MAGAALHGVSFADGEKVILVRYVNGEKIILVRHVDEETKNKINLDPEFVKEFIRKELLKEEKNGNKQMTNSSPSEKTGTASLEEEEDISSTVVPEFMKEFITINDEKTDGEKDTSSLDTEKSGITLIKDGSSPSSVERKNWTHEMTELMLSALVDNKKDFMIPSKKKAVFIRVKNKLLQYGHSFTVSDISRKYSNLLQTYKRRRDRRSKEDPQSWIYFDIIDEIIGSNFESSPPPKKRGSYSRSPSPTSSVPCTSIFEQFHGKRKRISNEERESIEERKLMLLESLIKARIKETPPDDDSISRKLQKLNSTVDKISESAHKMAEAARVFAESAQSLAASVNKINDLVLTNYKNLINNCNDS